MMFGLAIRHEQTPGDRTDGKFIGVVMEICNWEFAKRYESEYVVYSDSI